MTATATATAPAETAGENTAIRPFRFEASEAELIDLRRRIGATSCPNGRPSPITRRACSSRRSQKLARYWATDYDWRKVRGAAQRAAALHHRDRRARHPLHPRALEARERAADHRHARLARLDHRAAEDHRAADQPDGARRQRVGRVRCGDPVDARLRLLGQADRRPAGVPTRIARAWVDADEAPRLHAVTSRRAATGARSSST